MRTDHGFRLSPHLFALLNCGLPPIFLNPHLSTPVRAEGMMAMGDNETELFLERAVPAAGSAAVSTPLASQLSAEAQEP
jgi:hypothetical protein